MKVTFSITLTINVSASHILAEGLHSAVSGAMSNDSEGGKAVREAICAAFERPSMYELMEAHNKFARLRKEKKCCELVEFATTFCEKYDGAIGCGLDDLLNV